ncbi:MAG: oxidoreductase [Flavobacteriaceae bacterium]|nr:oxidoreductase [Flavobacteriaceae bacterium]
MAKLNSRRSFIKKSAAASAGFFIVPRNVLGGPGFIAPSDQLGIAAVGSGGKGSSDLRNAYNAGVNRVVALCDIDPKRAGDSIKAHKKAKFYYDYREMLEKEKSIDAVTISTPDHTHALIAYDAMMRGKAVYVQKPLTHTIAEARLLTETARAQKVVTQMGNQGGSNEGVNKVIEWVKSNKVGTISKVNVWTNRPVWPQGVNIKKEDASKRPEDIAWDLWIGPAKSRKYTPGLHPFDWRGFWEYGTGALGDMGCHLFDAPYKALGLGYPSGVQSSVADVYSQMWTPDYTPEGCPISTRVTIDFPADELNREGVVFEWTDGGIQPAIPDLLVEQNFRPDSSGVMMFGSKGIITVDTYGNNPKLFREGEEMIHYDTSFQENLDLKHNQSWTEAVKAGFDSAEHKALTSSFDYAGPFTETVLMGNLAIRSHQLRRPRENGRGFDYYGRRKLYWDGNAMKVTNFDEANQFVTKPYRIGWELANL